MKSPLYSFLLLSFLFTSSTFAQIPESFLGVWNGNGVQSVPAISWTISIVIKNDGTEIAYPSLNCGGNLTLVSATSNQLIFREKINFGVNSCVIEGNVTLTVSESNPNELIFYYDSELHPGIAEGTVSRTKPNLEWPDLQPLIDDYNSKIGTNRAPYAHQILCIAQQSCVEYNNNPNGWANDFVLYMFKELIGSNGLVSSQEVSCESSTLNFTCFGKSALKHAAELYGTFIRYCIYNTNNIDYNKWDNDHEAFLSQALSPCFQDLQSSNELIPLVRLVYENRAINYARTLRIESQALCDYLDFFNLQLPQPMQQEELIIPDLIDAGNLTVSNNAQYFVAVSEEIKLTVNHSQTGEDITDSPNTNYYINTSDDYVQISGQGLINILSAPSPLVNSRDPLIVYVENNGEFGYAQFAIYDIDSDQDFIVDSYEQSVGLDPSSPNLDSLDSDNDGLFDLVEILARTQPLNPDSDNDFYDDSFEIKAGSDPLDFNSTPLSDNTVTSVNNSIEATNFNIVIYPNPSNGEIKVDLSDNLYTNISLFIYDTNGRLALNKSIKITSNNSEYYSIKTDNLISGIYYCVFMSDGIVIENKKIIIKNY